MTAVPNAPRPADPLVRRIAAGLAGIEANYAREGSGPGSRFEGRLLEDAQAEWAVRQLPGGPPAPGHRTLNLILRDAIRASVSGDAGRLPGLRGEYDAAAAALFDTLTTVRDPAP